MIMKPELEEISEYLNFSIIIPCYNEERAIEKTLTDIENIITNQQYELIVVNDGSTDQTSTILNRISSNHPNIKVIHSAHNRGYGASLKIGIRSASSDIIVITDADGTYPNDRIPELVSIVKQGAAMAVGARIGEDVTYSKVRKIPKFFMRKYASWIAGRDIPDFNSGLRAFRRSIGEKYLNILPDGFSFTTTITLALLTNYYDVKYIPISYSTRIGKSKIKPIHDTLKFFQLIIRTGTYFAPLRVFFQ